MAELNLESCRWIATAWYRKYGYVYRTMWGKVYEQVFYIDVCKQSADVMWETKNVVLSAAALTEEKAWLSALEGITAWYGFDTIDELLVRLDLEGI